jgi:arabinose-5-phosphate isomerase
MEGIDVSPQRAAHGRQSSSDFPRLPVNPSAAETIPAQAVERLRTIRQTMVAEGSAITDAAARISLSAVRAAEMTAGCQGCVIVTGIGKAGLVGQKLVATLASTGSPSHFLHPSEAVHGDLGRVRDIDLVWAISNSGRSEELLRIAPHLRQHSSGLISITATEDNPLAGMSDCVVAIGKHREACPNALAPTSSTAVMMAVGDAIAMLASQLRAFTPQDFARFHPGGSLGQKLAKIVQIMRPIEACRVAKADDSVRQAIVSRSPTGRRTGAVMLVDHDGRLAGIFTDSDLARLLENRNDAALDDPISQRMSSHPTTATPQMSLQDAIAIMSRRRISELPVIDEQGRPLGLVDITDLVSLTP